MKVVTITLVLNEEELKRLNEIAKRLHITVDQLVQRWIRDDLDAS